MKRYLIEFDEKNMWSYEAASEGADVKFKLMRPHGDKCCAVDEYVDYRNWFQEEVGEANDVCFVYAEGDEAECEYFIPLLEIKTRSKVSKWTATELKLFFERDRDDRLTVEFDEQAQQFFLSDGRKLIIRGAAKLDWVDDLKEFMTSKEEPPTVKEEPPTVEEAPISNVKVFAPIAAQPLEVESLTVEEIAPSIEPSAQEQSKAEALRKITAVELQEYIQNLLKGQCDTVPLKN